MKEEYNPNGEIFYCINDDAWRRKLGCKFRAVNKIDGCSVNCKQAIKEKIFITTTITKRKTK